MADFSEIATWAVGQLTGDATLTSLDVDGVFFNNAPEGTPSPTIIFQKQTGAYTYTLGNSDAYTRHWLSIKCVDENLDGGDRARQVMKRVKAILNGQTPALDEGYTMNFKAQTDFEYGEQESGNIQYYHVGTVFVAWLGE